MLGPKPTDPSKITFAKDAFVQVGTRTEWYVLRSALHSGPARFDNEEAARAYARKVNREVSSREIPVMQRIRWTD